jgi:hypothetical protein
MGRVRSLGDILKELREGFQRWKAEDLEGLTNALDNPPRDDLHKYAPLGPFGITCRKCDTAWTLNRNTRAWTRNLTRWTCETMSVGK